MAFNIVKRVTSPLINYLGKKKIKGKFNKDPIIIGGCGRSGTTLLLSIISAHPEIFVFPKEIAVFSEWHNEKPRLDRFYRYILLNKIPDNKKRWCEKTPANVRYFDKILSYFNNNVKLIHIIRDGRDVMLSKHPKKPGEYWVSPERWLNDVKAGLQFKDHPNVFTLKYENLILNYTEVVKNLCNFINENFTKELDDWYDNTMVKKNEAWNGKVKKLHSNSIAKYKKTSDKKRIKNIMSNEEVVNLLKKLNYEVENI